MLVNLEVLPSGNDAFFWSDFAEINALVHADKCFSRNDLATLDAQLKTKERPADSEKLWRALIDYCGIRSKSFNEYYPFVVSEDQDTLELNFDDSHEQRLYLGMLVAASMRHIPKVRQGQIARAFEETCFAVFSKLMPEGSEIRATWANGGPEAPYTGHLYEKMTQVANDIRGNPDITMDDFKPNNTGDGGIDLIAWHPMGDERPGIPISFAQCGCSTHDWTFKQAEASPFLHKNHFRVMHEWATYYFMPVDLREFNGRWAYKSKIGSVIIVDRLRMLRLVGEFAIHKNLPGFDFIDEVMGFKAL
jgi:hypothetical protein